MKNKQNTDNQVNYKYGSYINYKAFKDYHVINNINDGYFNVYHCMIMGFILDEFHKNNNMPQLLFENEKYVLMNTNYILDNLIYLGIKESMFKKHFRLLKVNGLVKIKVIKRKDRYVNVNKQLIELCFNLDYTIKPTNYLEQYKPHLWKSFKNEWEQYFKDKISFKKFIDDFNDTRNENDYNYNSKEIYFHLLNAVQFKIYGKIHTDYLK
ncbi:hypothetical protein [Confluentibacter flavum]|uniref:Uncharacterized protein n=1 Tax=Confluentibacter flavum TaxID=1909700 RepID=A0A2N3HLT1_9FLAO|nr:hypothetical protein [Confluentibacter flavum]PKQ45911.1 hypothetical protein CSW08_05680 [Confluentibacter flavum]